MSTVYMYNLIEYDPLEDKWGDRYIGPMFSTLEAAQRYAEIRILDREGEAEQVHWNTRQDTVDSIVSTFADPGEEDPAAYHCHKIMSIPIMDAEVAE